MLGSQGLHTTECMVALVGGSLSDDKQSGLKSVGLSFSEGGGP